MNNEIKEILDKCTPFLFGDEVDKLLDYITNLQDTKTNMEQELQELYLIKDNLQEENKRLHTRIKTIKRRRKAPKLIHRLSSSMVAALPITFLLPVDATMTTSSFNTNCSSPTKDEFT